MYEPTRECYDWFLLDNKDISNKYTMMLRNKFDALQEISESLTPNEKYEKFINAHIEAAAECILTTRPTNQRPKQRVP